MKNRILSGMVVILLGLLIAFGPQFIFKVCASMGDGFPRCHWSARGEIGIGLLIAALGAALLIFAETKIRLGLTIGVFFSSIIAISIPHALIGGCAMMTMACRRVAFPSITLIGIVLLAGSALNAFYLANNDKSDNPLVAVDHT
ncbi:MAG: DUF4418 family protein [Treponema sp.]|jgi:hypothetical protein|nr:DUF4418 family protein [Treponema sp.]